MHTFRISPSARPIHPPESVPGPGQVAHGAATRLTGWGRGPGSAATLVRPGPSDHLTRMLDGHTERGVIARGMGRSYGDAALNAGGTVIDLTGRNRILHFDAAAGILVAQAGATLAQVAERIHPLGWLPTVLPGTLHVTLGGAVASDVHGKNHVSAGSFGNHVRWIDLLQADGNITRLSADDTDPRRFWATVGGMGLTGIILRISIQCQRAGGSVLRHQQRLRSLEDVLAVLDEQAARQRKNDRLHAIAWVDAARPIRSGVRGIVETACLLGEGASPEPPHGSAARVASLPGPGLMTRSTIRALNALRWSAAADSRWTVSSVRAALQPLDRIEAWPAAFGRRGLIQCQIAIPDGEEETLSRSLATLRSLGTPPALTTIKRFGPASLAPLSFPIPGWTMAMDFPAGWPDLATGLDRIDKLVMRAGGRVYLAKDSRTTSAVIASMYRRLPEWQETQMAMDPGRTFTSDLGRRTGLILPRDHS